MGEKKWVLAVQLPGVKRHSRHVVEARGDELAAFVERLKMNMWGEVALETVGRWRWTKRVHKIISILETVINYDMLYVGGGNARLIEPPLPPNVKIVSNMAGITGGVWLWDGRMDHAFAEKPPAFAEQSD